MIRPSVLCPIDFSESSRGALRYAASTATHFGSRLTLLAVNDPLLQEADEFSGAARLTEDTRQELERFLKDTFAARPRPADVHVTVTTGKAAPEILRAARDHGCGVIVMSSHGLTGFRKLFFGSTTERVLRETVVPVLVTPGTDAGPETPEDVTRLVRRVLVPMDLTSTDLPQLRTARGLAEALSVPLVLVHVVEPIRAAPAAQARVSSVDAERRHRADAQLEKAVNELPPALRPEALVAYGEPAEEIAKVAADRDVGMIVMGLHSSPVLGARMGSVTYRVLCLAHRLVLGVPPEPAAT